MDRYHAYHQRDEASFDLPSTHRLPPVSAADALEDLDNNVSRYVSTGLEELDKALSSSAPEPPLAPGQLGVPRGQVTEVWGPPGSGKTGLGRTDCSYVVCGRRLESVVHAASPETGSAEPSPANETLRIPVTENDKFVHYACRTLPHFLALLCQPTATTLPDETAIIVVDSLSALINHVFPKVPEDRSGSKPGTPFRKGRGPAARLQTLQYVISALQKLAATRNCAVVILSQCATKMQFENGATLVPSVNASVWDQGISTRIVLFRDWVWKDNVPSTVCFAGVQKREGTLLSMAVHGAAAFHVQKTGLVGIRCDASQPSIALSATPRPKRKLADSALEVPDSDEEDEDYGWGEEDDAAAPIPPQTQGSEDLLLGVHRHEEDEDGDDDDTHHVGGEDDDSENDSGVQEKETDQP
ncbi:hypothetical protein ACRALDRAFT_2043407 [Sodiomyces alcalophilus JCM 7366]|uniref:uncharacterized protein n=1 Tax=Sodiomyces alcalophilus JCM 7366 TaxID=591952 RepID=UPI0039B47106